MFGYIYGMKLIFINKPVPFMAVFVLQGHIINKHVYFRSINGLKALVYDIVLFNCEFWFLRSR